MDPRFGPYRRYDQNFATFTSPPFRELDRSEFKRCLHDFRQRLQQQPRRTKSGIDREIVAADRDWSQTLTPLNFGRRLLLPTDQPLQIEDILQTNALYDAEAKFLEGTQSAALSAMLHTEKDELDVETFTAEERAQHLKAVHEAVRR